MHIHLYISLVTMTNLKPILAGERTKPTTSDESLQQKKQMNIEWPHCDCEAPSPQVISLERINTANVPCRVSNTHHQ